MFEDADFADLRYGAEEVNSTFGILFKCICGGADEVTFGCSGATVVSEVGYAVTG